MAHHPPPIWIVNGPARFVLELGELEGRRRRCTLRTRPRRAPEVARHAPLLEEGDHIQLARANSGGRTRKARKEEARANEGSYYLHQHISLLAGTRNPEFRVLIGGRRAAAHEQLHRGGEDRGEPTRGVDKTWRGCRSGTPAVVVACASEGRVEDGAETPMSRHRAADSGRRRATDASLRTRTSSLARQPPEYRIHGRGVGASLARPPDCDVGSPKL